MRMKLQINKRGKPVVFLMFARHCGVALTFGQFLNQNALEIYARQDCLRLKSDADRKTTGKKQRE